MHFWNFKLTDLLDLQVPYLSPTRQRSGFTTRQCTAPVSTVAIEDCNKTPNVRLAHIYMHTCIQADGGDHTHKSD